MNLTNDQIATFLADKEWYHNSSIKVIRGCKRKAFYSLVGPEDQPLSAGVGDGANFGSCMHAATARYFNTWGKFTEGQRRVFGARAFSDEWQQYFPHERMQSKHRLVRGLDIFDAYCERYLGEDGLFEPVHSELGFCIEIDTSDVCDEPPFWYIGRIDGIMKRLSDGRLFLRELKTTSSLPEPRLRQLKFDHQPIGYVWCARHLAGNSLPIEGVLGDVIQVAANKCDFARDYFPISERQCDEWRRQLIYTVRDWRALKREAQSAGVMRFYQDTERCFEYGKCAFYDLCDFGARGELLADFSTDQWNPLMQRTPPEVLAQDANTNSQELFLR